MHAQILTTRLSVVFAGPLQLNSLTPKATQDSRNASGCFAIHKEH